MAAAADRVVLMEDGRIVDEVKPDAALLAAQLSALGVIVRADLFGRRCGTTLVLLTVFTVAAAAIVAGFESQSRAADLWNATFDEANGAHVTVSTDDEATLVGQRAKVGSELARERASERDRDQERGRDEAVPSEGCRK